MADQSQQIEKKEKAEAAPKAPQAPQQVEAPKGLDTSRQDIAGALETEAEEGGELVETGERVSEIAAEGKEQKGVGMGGKKKKDDSKAAAITFTFDESNLPPAPEMIQRIERQLRAEIHLLEKKARIFQGSLFRKPDYSKYSETMIEMRKKTVLLRRLITMAADSIKKLFIRMFSPKNMTK